MSENSTVKLLQTYMEQDPIVSKDKEILLFLEKYDGPVIKDAFTIVGAWFGQFEIIDGKIHSKVKVESKEVDNYVEFNEKVEKFPNLIDMENFYDILEENAYEKPKNKIPMTEEEIEKLNERERMLEKELTEI